MRRDHCHYCSKPLYTMQLNQRTGTVTSVETVRDHNSNGEHICAPCGERLIRRGTVVECARCDAPVYTIRNDRFPEDRITVYDLQGIPPQRDPLEGVYNRCIHCKNIIDWG